jgi:hypothetical protein
MVAVAAIVVINWLTSNRHYKGFLPEAFFYALRAEYRAKITGWHFPPSSRPQRLYCLKTGLAGRAFYSIPDLSALLRLPAGLPDS